MTNDATSLIIKIQTREEINLMNIYFDMDGTIADLYSQNNWQSDLENGYKKPYLNAKSLVNMRKFGKELNRLQSLGHKIGIISWTSKSGNDDYAVKVINAKLTWLKKHLSAVKFNEIHIIKYGTPKYWYCKNSTDILFDDEKKNRDNWTGVAYDEKNILETLSQISYGA